MIEDFTVNTRNTDYDEKQETVSSQAEKNHMFLLMKNWNIPKTIERRYGNLGRNKGRIWKSGMLLKGNLERILRKLKKNQNELQGEMTKPMKIDVETSKSKIRSLPSSSGFIEPLIRYDGEHLQEVY